MVRGRNFTPEEQREDRGAVIISKNVADRYWPGEDPMGKRLKWGIAESRSPWLTIVGVAGDVVDGPLGSEPAIHAYVPYPETPDEALAAAPQRFSAAVLTGFAAGALLMAAVGLYGVLAFVVAQRTREIGVRLALGAPPARVLGQVVERGMRLVAIGLLLGLATAVGTARLPGSFLYETDTYDLVTFVTVPALLALVSLAACYLPARRAAAVDPMVALREG